MMTSEKDTIFRVRTKAAQDDAVLAFVTENPGSRLDFIDETLGFGTEALRASLARLSDDELVRSTRGGRGTVFYPLG